MLSRKLPALFVVLCLLACEALAGGMSRCSCCSVRPCCPSMAGGKGAMAGAACATHRADLPGSSCSLRPAGEGLAILHVHPELPPRPAVFPSRDVAPLPRLAARLPERAERLPVSPSARPETPPPRLPQVV